MGLRHTCLPPPISRVCYRRAGTTKCSRRTSLTDLLHPGHEAAATGLAHTPDRYLDRRIRIRITTRLKRTYAKPLNTSPPTTLDGFSIVCACLEGPRTFGGNLHTGGIASRKNQKSTGAESGQKQPKLTENGGINPLLRSTLETHRGGQNINQAQAHTCTQPPRRYLSYVYPRALKPEPPTPPHPSLPVSHRVRLQGEDHHPGEDDPGVSARHLVAFEVSDVKRCVPGRDFPRERHVMWRLCQGVFFFEGTTRRRGPGAGRGTNGGEGGGGAAVVW